MQWTPSSGFSTDSAEWQVTGAAGAFPNGTPTPGVTSTPTAGTPGQALSLEETVNAYFDAMNLRDYQKAWDLGGKNTGSSYASFVRGFKATAIVSVQILDVSGDIGTAVVTARLTTLETDGSSKVFEGEYTVRNGVIVKCNVHQVS